MPDCSILWTGLWMKVSWVIYGDSFKNKYLYHLFIDLLKIIPRNMSNSASKGSCAPKLSVLFYNICELFVFIFIRTNVIGSYFQKEQIVNWCRSLLGKECDYFKKISWKAQAQKVQQEFISGRLPYRMSGTKAFGGWLFFTQLYHCHTACKSLFYLFIQSGAMQPASVCHCI